MNQEFKKISDKTETRYILESMTAGATGGGSIATSEKPVGEVQKRNPNPTPRSPVAHAAQKVAKGSGAHKNPAKTIPRKEKHKGREVAEADFDPNRLKMIQNKIKQSKGGTPLRRDEKGELSDLMKGFNLDRLKKAMSGQTSEGGEPDHEISMAGSELHSIYQDAKQLHAMIKHYSEMDGLDAWQQSKITKAADYLNSVLQSLQHEMMGEGWSQKYKNSINCSHPKGFSQKAHCAGKRKHTESTVMEMTCPDCGMCRTHGDNMMEVKQRLDAHCWKGKHKEGTKIKGGVRVNNCVPNESVAEAAKWRHDDLVDKTWRSADWDDGDLSPGKIQIDRHGKDVDDSGDELNARPGMWGGKYKRMTKKGTPTQHELGMQNNTKMRMKMQNKQGGLTGPKGRLPEE